MKMIADTNVLMRAVLDDDVAKPGIGWR